MEDHEISWKADSLAASRSAARHCWRVVPAANPLGRPPGQRLAQQWQVSFDAMEHDFSSPLHVQLQNVTFGREGKPATLVAKTVDIGFSTRQFSDPLHADEIVLNDGTLNLSPHSADLPFAADRLMLRNMAFNSPETGWALSAQRVTGGVSPWTPEAGNVLGKTAQIQMSAGSMTLNGVEASNVLIQGRIDQGEVTLSTLGADVARGTLTGNAKRSADGSWLVDNLQPRSPLCRLAAWISPTPACRGRTGR